jgi:hypothetical protein
MTDETLLDEDDFDDLVTAVEEAPPVDEYRMSTRPTTPPPIVLELGGIEDFETAVALLRATGARRRTAGRSGRRGNGSSRTFVIDQDITAQQAAALLEFIKYGTDQGFLTVTVNAPEPDYRGADEWWETA